jgi:hypothetical protein
MTKLQRNLLRVPGLFLRVPLMCIVGYILEPVSDGVRWLCDRYLRGLEPWW